MLVECASPFTSYRHVDGDRWYVHLLPVKDEPYNSVGITLRFENSQLIEALGSTVGVEGPVALRGAGSASGVTVDPLAGGWIRIDESNQFDVDRFGAEVELDYPSGATLQGTITPQDNDRADAGPPADAAP
jgi:hypothetical protein